MRRCRTQMRPLISHGSASYFSLSYSLSLSFFLSFFHSLSVRSLSARRRSLFSRRPIDGAARSPVSSGRRRENRHGERIETIAKRPTSNAGGAPPSPKKKKKKKKTTTTTNKKKGRNDRPGPPIAQSATAFAGGQSSSLCAPSFYFSFVTIIVVVSFYFGCQVWRLAEVVRSTVVVPSVAARSRLKTQTKNDRFRFRVQNI